MKAPPGDRKLGPGLASVIVAGNIIAAAIYALPASLGAVGSVSVIGWALAALAAYAVALALCLLAGETGDPDGLVGYADHGLGPFWGFCVAIFYWMSTFVAIIAVAVALAGYLTVFVPALSSPIARTLAAIGALFAAAGLNLLGARSVGRFGVLALAAGLIPLVALGAFGWIVFDPRLFAASWNVTGRSDVFAVRSSVVGAFFAFTGFETGAAMSAIVRHPRRNVPIATVVGVSLAAVVYLSVSTVLMGLAPARAYAQSSAPLALAMMRVGGPALAGTVAVCALLKTAGSLGGLTLAAAETARAGLDAYFRRRPGALADPAAIPRKTLLLTALAAALLTGLSTAPTFARQFDVLIDVSALWTIVAYILCAAALLRLATTLKGRRRASLLAAAALALLVSLAIMASGTALSLLLTLGLAVVALVLWRGWARRFARPPASPRT
jgi:arginine:agmatine antiporter